MTDEAVIRWLLSFGGKFYVRDDDNPKWNTAYDWVITRRKDVRYFLEKIAPYMRVKRAQALEAIEAIKRLEKRE